MHLAVVPQGLARASQFAFLAFFETLKHQLLISLSAEESPCIKSPMSLLLCVPDRLWDDWNQQSELRFPSLLIKIKNIMDTIRPNPLPWLIEHLAFTCTVVLIVNRSKYFSVCYPWLRSGSSLASKLYYRKLANNQVNWNRIRHTWGSVRSNYSSYKGSSS